MNPSPRANAPSGALRPARPRGWLLVDVHGLICDDAPFRRWFRSALVAADLWDRVRPYSRGDDQSWRRDWASGLCDVRGALERFLRNLGAGPGLAQELAASAVPRRRRYDHQSPVLPRSGRTIARLRAAGWRIAILGESDEPGPVFRLRLAARGLLDAFDAAVTSVELRQALDGPGAWRAARQRLGLMRPELRLLAVSCRPECLDRALEAGLPSIECPAVIADDGRPVARSLIGSMPTAAFVGRATSFAELPEWLERLGPDAALEPTSTARSRCA